MTADAETTHPFPRRVTLELTNSCNLRCVFCPRGIMEQTQGFMEPALFKKAVDEMADHLPVALVPFFRGESLLHPRFLELVGYAARKGVGPVQMTTNAMLLNDDLARGIINAGVDFISFSLDTSNAEIYERSRPGAIYEKAAANVERFIDLREHMGAGKPEIQVSGVLTEENAPYKDEFAAKWRGRADRVRIFVEHSRDGRFGSLDGHALPEFQKRLPCHKVFEDMVVYWDGGVALCNHDWSRPEPIGNISEQSIADIWAGERYRLIREQHLSGSIEDPVCSGCDHWVVSHIAGGFIGELYVKERSARAGESEK